MSSLLQRSFLIVFALSFLTAIPVSRTQAAGFYVQEQSVTNLGRAYAGQAASPYDATTVYANPAGMTMLSGPQVSVGVTLINPHVKSRNTGTTLSGSPVTGSNGDQVYDPTFVPNAYGAMPIKKDLWAGIAISAPFGLVTSYDSDWFGRYNSIYSSLKVIDTAPSVAYKVNDWLSIGGGIDLQYATAKLTSDIRLFGLDALSSLEGHSFAVGANVGILAKPMKDFLIGLTYRSPTHHHIRGMANVFLFGSPVSTSVARTTLNTPDIAGLALAYNLSPRLTILGQVNWFNWSRFSKLKITTDSGTLVKTQNYHDVASGSVGFEYKWNDAWTFRSGYQYDPTPTSNTYRTSAIPDATRNFLAAGFSYNYTPNVTFDVGYTHGFLKPTKINVTDELPLGGGTAITRAKIQLRFDIIGAALRYRF